MLMSHFLALNLLATPMGQFYLEDKPEDAKVYATSSECEPRVEDGIVIGPVDCRVTIAVVNQDGTVIRQQATLSGESPIEPKVLQDEDAPIAGPRAQPDSMPTRIPDSSTKPDGDGPGSEIWLHVSRDLGDFGFSSGGVGLSLPLNTTVYFETLWEHGVGRAQTRALDGYANAIEQTSDLFLAGIVLRRKVEGKINARFGLVVGPGIVKGAGAQTEREVLSSSAQPLFAVRPQLGFEAQAGRVALRILGTLTWATGNWYPADDYGSREELTPPEQTGILAYALHFGVGLRL